MCRNSSALWLMTSMLYRSCRGSGSGRLFLSAVTKDHISRSMAIHAPRSMLTSEPSVLYSSAMNTPPGLIFTLHSAMTPCTGCSPLATQSPYAQLKSCDGFGAYRLASGTRGCATALPNTARSSNRTSPCIRRKCSMFGLCGLTFELTGRQRWDARPGLARMYRVPPDRAWWPAVGAPVERGVRRLCTRNEYLRRP
jgi:hypothetical protein